MTTGLDLGFLGPGSIRRPVGWVPEEGETMTALATLRGQLIVAAALAVAGCAPSANRDPVVMTDRGKVDLAPYECQNDTGSGFITRVCYDAGSRRMLLGFQDGTYRLYCRVGASIPNGLLSAQYMSKFYSERIRGTGKRGPFDCGARRVAGWLSLG